MAKKPKPKKRTKPRKRRSGTRGQLAKIGACLAILVILIIGAGVLAHHLLLQYPARVTPPEVAVHKIPDQAHHSKPRFEVFPKDERTPVKPEIKPRAPVPQVAIIIDDLGYDLQMAENFLDLDVALTFSMLPQGPFSGRIISRAYARGMEIMLHLPMEPNEYPQVNPGPGALLTRMPPDELIARLNRDLDAVAHVRGVNNHMGSKMTASAPQMRQIFTTLKKRGLYFIDSRTTTETLCRDSARLLRLPFAERDIFIDHLQNPDFIRKQLHRLLQRAQRQGHAVGIAHPHPVTIEVLRHELPNLKKEVQFVPASRVVAKVG
jgi:hypothetical protein